jgi:amino acid adenylation domain-containing protein
MSRRDGLAPEVRAVSSVQRGLWGLGQVFPGVPDCNVCFAVRLHGPIDTGTARASLAELARRHEILRATFPVREGQPVTHIDGFGPPTMPVVDLSGLPVSFIQAESARLERVHAGHAFDLQLGPLMQAVLIRGDADRHTLLISLHRMICDAWSTRVLVDEFLATYELLTKGRPVAGTPPAQYADVMARIESEGLVGRERHLRYWRERLGDLSAPPGLPPDWMPATNRGMPTAVARQSIDPDMATAIRAFARAERVTPFMVMLTAFMITLARYLDRDDVVVGTHSALREDPDTHRVIGPFLNLLALRADLSGNPAVREALARVRDTCLGAYEHQAVPFEKVVADLAAGRETGNNPFFSIAFEFLDSQPEQPSRGGLDAQVATLELGLAKSDLSIDVVRAGDRLNATACYNTDLYHFETIDALLRHWLTILRNMIEAGGKPVSQLPMTDPAEHQMLLTAALAEPVQAPSGGSILDLFEEYAATQPAAPAVISDTSKWTYGDLDRYANSLARRLIGEGVRPGDRVGIYMERSAQSVATVLAVWKAGAAYVPLDTDSPAGRRRLILTDAGVTVVLAQRHLAEDLRDDTARLVIVDDEPPPNSVSVARPSRIASADTICYVIYTSGSTGQPKGVVSTHGALMHIQAAWEQVLRLRGRVRRHLQMANFSFDGYVGELIRCLGSGGTLVVCPRETLLMPGRMLELMRRESVDAADFVPAVLRTLISHVMESDGDLSFLKVLIVGSDTFPADELARVREFCGPRTTVVNCYGLTEGTIDSAYFTVDDTYGDIRAVIIGVPLPGVETYLLDTAMRPVPPGVPGTIYLAGPTLARGYLGDPVRTAQFFLPNPWGERPGARMYRTGDRARYRRTSQGLLIEFLGRTDQQIKVRGYRVELGEIEAALRRSPGVRDVVAVTEGNGTQQVIHAYVVLRSSAESGTDWFAVLRDNVPPYMLPNRIVLLDRLPLTANGKLDRAALAIDRGRDAVDRSGVDAVPRTSTQAGLLRHWEHVLGCSELGINDDFFARGGNSLLAMRAIAMARDEFGVDISVRAFFIASTVADLAREVDKLSSGKEPAVADQITAVRREYLDQGTVHG